MPSRPLHIFHHLPKTGGTSIRSLLQRNYRFRLLFLPDGKHSIAWHAEHHASWSRLRRWRIRCVVSHTAQFLIPVLPEKPRVFAVARAPVDRVVSLYFRLRRRVDPPAASAAGIVRDRDWEIEDIYRHVGAADADPGLRACFAPFFNGQSRAILAPHFPGLDLGFSTDLPADAEPGLRHTTSEYYLLGAQDEMNRSIELFARELGWRHATLEELNVAPNRPRRYEPPPHVEELIRDHNRLDTMLHRLATEGLERGSTPQRS